MEDKGQYIPSVQYYEPYRSWLIRFVKQYGEFLSSPESWRKEFLEQVRRDSRFRLNDGDYESSENWKSFNDFFTRELADLGKRPIAGPQDDSIVVSPADAEPQGVWAISDNNELIAGKGQTVGQPDFVTIKSKQFKSVTDLLGQSRYREAFAGGTMTHMFLDVFDYHRYHFPVSGVVREVLHIPGDTAVGGYIKWEPQKRSYQLKAGIPGWQMIETRALVIIETEEYGLVAVLPVGMSQVSSVVFDAQIKPGVRVEKGQKLGMFLFGGSAIVMLFQKGVTFTLTHTATDGTYPHLLTGQEYGRIRIR